MMERIQEITILLSGMIIIIAPFIREFRKEPKRNWNYILLIGCSSLILVVLSIIKIKNDLKRSEKTDEQIDILVKNVDYLRDQVRTDSINNQNFLISLKEEFGIQKDSITNQPIKIFNTKIDKADIVNIGNDN